MPPAEAVIPAVHALHVLELLRGWNVGAEALLEGTGLTESGLAAPEATLDVPAAVRLVQRARALAGEPALGFLAGLQMRVSAHGYLGFAAMTARTARDALDLAVRFAPLRTDALTLAYGEEGGRAWFEVRERADFGPARDAVIPALLVGIWRIGEALTEQTLRGVAELAFPEPPYFEKLRGFLANEVRFGAPANRLLFDADVLDLPLMGYDPAAHRLAVRQCEEALALHVRGGPLLLRVRHLLVGEDGRFRTAGEVARAAGLSERTLKRRLAECGASYSALLEEARRERATRLLASDALSVEEVADRLGYSDAANFTRAFRRWTGAAPRAWRREREGEG